MLILDANQVGIYDVGVCHLFEKDLLMLGNERSRHACVLLFLLRYSVCVSLSGGRCVGRGSHGEVGLERLSKSDVNKSVGAFCGPSDLVVRDSASEVTTFFL